MKASIVIRNGMVVDGTGAAPTRADVAIDGDRIVAVEANWDGTAERTIDADGKLVTPGFVDIHTHLDAQLAWDPVGTSSCWHGITTAALGNCGVTFAPVQPNTAARAFLAEMMESVEDIPREAILEGLPWDWTGYDGYLSWLDRIPKGMNVGGLVGHCAVRVAAMGERSLDETPANADDLALITAFVDEAMRAGALGFSTSRTFLHKVPDGRVVPGTHAADDEMLAIAEVLGRHGRGTLEGAYRLGERDAKDLPNTRREIALMGEMSRRSGRPLTYGLTQHDARPDLYSKAIQWSKEENANGAQVRPQTTARSVGILFGLHNRTPFDRFESWRELRNLTLTQRLDAIRDPQRRQRLVDEVLASDAPTMDYNRTTVMLPGAARYDHAADETLAAHAQRRGLSPVETFLQLADETNGAVVLSVAALNQRLGAIQEMLDDPVVSLGLADAGAHVGQIMDSSQPTFFLSYWVRERKRWAIEEAIRRLTSDTADLFGIKDRGRVRVGGFADLNVFALENLALPIPEYVHDFPNGAGRYVQGSSGYDATIVNGTVFMEQGEHTGALAGRVVRSTD